MSTEFLWLSPADCCIVAGQRSFPSARISNEALHPKRIEPPVCIQQGFLSLWRPAWFLTCEISPSLCMLQVFLSFGKWQDLLPARARGSFFPGGGIISISHSLCRQQGFLSLRGHLYLSLHVEGVLFLSACIVVPFLEEASSSFICIQQLGFTLGGQHVHDTLQGFLSGVTQSLSFSACNRSSLIL
jgi:hypothetical protein